MITLQTTNPARSAMAADGQRSVLDQQRARLVRDVASQPTLVVADLSGYVGIADDFLRSPHLLHGVLERLHVLCPLEDLKAHIGVGEQHILVAREPPDARDCQLTGAVEDNQPVLLQEAGCVPGASET